MKELKCPNCGSVFTVDEADYASILNQIKNQEFHDEVERRMVELRKQQEVEQEAGLLKAKQDFMRTLSEREVELAKRTSEIEQLQVKLQAIEKSKRLEMDSELAKKEQEILHLKSVVAANDNLRKIAVMEEQQRAQDVLRQKEANIVELRGKIQSAQDAIKLKETELTSRFNEQLRMKDEIIERYKDFRAKLSTKMIGESLEQHCSIQYNQYLRSILPYAYFEKDNDASGGSKGDFIFRDFGADGTEYISIMFEMKNEADETATKHRNEDFFKKLDADRKAKNCEFAVLVSLLEQDNDLYNGGIVDVSHKYEKMYVIRPQFFIPLITLLVQTSKKSLEFKQQLAIAQAQSVDVTNFENKVNDFREKFSRHYEQSAKKFEDAIKNIDDTISKLQKVRENLLSSDKYLRLASKDTEGLTIKRLTHGNPTMRAKFDEARRKADGSGGDLLEDD